MHEIKKSYSTVQGKLIYLGKSQKSVWVRSLVKGGKRKRISISFKELIKQNKAVGAASQ